MLLYLNKLSCIIFVVSVSVVEEKDTGKVLLEEILYLLSKLLTIL